MREGGGTPGVAVATSLLGVAAAAAAVWAPDDAVFEGHKAAVFGGAAVLLGLLSAYLVARPHGGVGKVLINVVLRLAPRSLDLEEVLKAAAKTAGVSDPRALLDEGTLAATEALLRSCREDAGLTVMGQVVANGSITGGLVGALTMIKDRETAVGSSVLKRPITSPIFIAGPNRTGTTYLHRLLGQDEGAFLTPKHFELMTPRVWGKGIKSQAEHDKQSMKFVEGFLMMSNKIMPELGLLHTFGATLPEEDTNLQVTFQSAWAYAVFWELTGFKKWLASAAARPAQKASHALHHNYMQYLQYNVEQRESEAASRDASSAAAANGRKATPVAERRLINKSPFHMFTLEHLFEEYPDAVVIQTHRKPREIILSWFHLVLVQHEGLNGCTLTEAERHRKIGRAHLNFMRNMVDSATAFRRGNPHLAERFIDVRFEDVVSKPLETASALYQRLGAEVPPAGGEVEGKMAAFRDQQNAKIQDGRAKRTVWKLEDFGVTEDQVEEAFAPYENWVQGLTMLPVEP